MFSISKIIEFEIAISLISKNISSLLILSLRDAKFKLRVWDPHIDIKTIEALNKDEILATQEKPNNIELAFICVYHKEILEFLDSYDGLVYDFRKLNKT